MTEVERLRARIKLLEDCWPTGHIKPAELTDEEYHGAPVHPGRNWNLRGPPLNEASWNYEVSKWEVAIFKWRAAHSASESK